MNTDVYKITMAAFLHDIGKFVEAGGMHIVGSFAEDHEGLYLPRNHSGYPTHKHALYTAAFIDHIEKLLPQEFNSAEWGLEDPFINLAAGHHKPETSLQWIIAMADRVSSGFDRDEFEAYNKGIGVRDYKKTRLLTIFEGISLDGDWKEDSPENYRYRYPLNDINPESIFPQDLADHPVMDHELADREYRELFENFIFALEKLSHRKYLPLWFEHFENLFMLYTSHIPAARVGKVVPDVSLYDHSKATAALAAAIYLYHKQTNNMEEDKIKDYKEKKLLFVTGDFYGIQNFIFSGGSQRSAAKLLRGRSFYVSLLSELAAYFLCTETGLTTVSTVLNAAGKFTIIAPNTEETRNMIAKAEEAMNEWLLNEFYGDVVIGISLSEACFNDLTSAGFRSLTDRLADAAEARKHAKIDLDKYGGVVTGYLDAFDNTLEKKLCPFCMRRPSRRTEEDDMPLFGNEGPACSTCRDHLYIGTNLVRSQRVAVTTSDSKIYGRKLKKPLFGRYHISFDVSGELNALAERDELLRYWDISIPTKKGMSNGITSRLINCYVPKYTKEDEHDDRLLYGKKSEEKKLELIDMVKEGLPKSFAHIAKKALNPAGDEDRREYRGMEALGVLRADVDNLGLIFTCGLKRVSLSRLATLSRQMNYYFSVYLPYVLSEREEFKDIYTVFSGGDDLFLVGPWNRIIEFSSHLAESFRRYVCDNEDVTISAGIDLCKPNEPLSQIAGRAGGALDRSKAGGRNSLTLFGETMKWDEFMKMVEVKEVMERWLKRGIVNNAMLYRFGALAQTAKQEKELIDSGEGVETHEWDYLLWRPRLKYSLARNVGRNLKGEERAAAVEEMEVVAEWLERYRGGLKVPVWQILYNLR